MNGCKKNCSMNALEAPDEGKLLKKRKNAVKFSVEEINCQKEEGKLLKVMKPIKVFPL